MDDACARGFFDMGMELQENVNVHHNGNYEKRRVGPGMPLFAAGKARPLPLLDAGHGRYRIPLSDAGGMEASGDRNLD
ncbi:MAG: hypothetical protein EBZ67_12885 [Chitinophagia bacterium]|nr:hypothetical protein [Chitinophagia bacterium]